MYTTDTETVHEWLDSVDAALVFDSDSDEESETPRFVPTSSVSTSHTLIRPEDIESVLEDFDGVVAYDAEGDIVIVDRDEASESVPIAADAFETALRMDETVVSEVVVVDREEAAGAEARATSFGAEAAASAGHDDAHLRGGVSAANARSATGGNVQRWLDSLINTIPGEVLVLWAALEGAAELYSLPLWAYALLLLFVLFATPAYVHRSIERPVDTPSNSDVQWWQEANVRWQSLSATGAFLVWVYYLGGPFQAVGLQNVALATVAVIVYPVLVVVSPYYGSFVLYYASRFRARGVLGEATR